MSPPDVNPLPGVSPDIDGPAFREPWQAQAFALVVELAESGAFTWREWTEALGAELAAAGAADTGERYYDQWLAALENLADAKGLTQAGERQARRDAWEAAAQATPHGEAIVLSRTMTEDR